MEEPDGRVVREDVVKPEPVPLLADRLKAAHEDLRKNLSTLGGRIAEGLRADGDVYEFCRRLGLEVQKAMMDQHFCSEMHNSLRLMRHWMVSLNVDNVLRHDDRYFRHDA